MSNAKQIENMKTQKLTVREVRKILFDSDLYSVIGQDEMTNKESRDFLYSLENQDQIINVIQNQNHLLIWNLQA
jgi:hypothetical protein